jgi:hypothetical protein
MRRFDRTAAALLPQIALLAAAGAAAGCTLDAARRHDERSDAPVDEAASGIEASPAPSPAPLRELPFGYYSIAAGYCDDDHTVAVSPPLTLRHRRGGTVVRREISAGCIVTQKLALTATTADNQRHLSFQGGKTICDGACPAECPPDLMAPGRRDNAPVRADLQGSAATPVLFFPVNPRPELCSGAGDGLRLELTPAVDESCMPRWTKKPADVGQVDILDDELKWSVAALTPNDARSLVLGSWPATLQDFTVTVDVDGFEAGAPGVAFMLELTNGDRSARVSLGRTDATAPAQVVFEAQARQGFEIKRADVVPVEVTDAAPGSLQVSVKAGKLTAAFSPLQPVRKNTKAVVALTAAAAPTPWTLKLQLLSNQAVAPAPTEDGEAGTAAAVALARVKIIDGRGAPVPALADEFDCETIRE